MADPGFLVAGGRRAVGGHRPLMWALFGENVCENKRIGSCWGGDAHWQHPLDPPMSYASNCADWSLLTQSNIFQILYLVLAGGEKIRSEIIQWEIPHGFIF